MRILTEITSLTQVLFSLSFSRNIAILIMEILFFNLRPRIRQLALFFPSNTSFKHRRKRVQRFLSSFNDKIFKVLFHIALSVLGNNDSILIAIDWTQIQKRYLFTAAIVLKDRTLPIAFLLRDRKRVIDRIKMIDLLRGIIPSHIQVTVIADGEFCSPAFLDYIHRNGYHYIVRMKKSMLFNGKKIGSYSIRTDTNGLYDFGFGKYTSMSMNARVVANTHNKQVYYLVTDLNYLSSFIVDTYRKRFLIEETFRDYKSGMGFGKYSNGMNEKRLLALLSIYTLSYMSMYEMTKGIVKDGRYSFYTRFRNKMIYTMGKDIFFENLNNLKVSHRAFK